MARNRNVRTWTPVDPNTLQPEALEAFEKFQQATDALKAARTHFEQVFSGTAELPSAERFLFSYQARGFSVAREPFKRKRATSKPVHFDKLKADLKRNGS